MQHFLTNFCQKVTGKTKASPWHPVNSGILQGSVLGPVLFTIYMNDLPETANPGTELCMYASDSKIFWEINSELDTLQFQDNLNNVFYWTQT